MQPLNAYIKLKQLSIIKVKAVLLVRLLVLKFYWCGFSAELKLIIQIQNFRLVRVGILFRFVEDSDLRSNLIDFFLNCISTTFYINIIEIIILHFQLYLYRNVYKDSV